MSQQTETAGVKLNFSTDWQYAPAPETARVQIAPRYDLFIDGDFRAPAKGEYFDTINPATEKKLADSRIPGTAPRRARVPRASR
jgi:hypothetical protein